MEKTAKVMLVGGVSWNTMVQLSEWFASPQGSGAADGWFQALGSTGAGKALNMQQLGFDVFLHSLLGSDAVAQRIRSAFGNTAIHCDWHVHGGSCEQHLNLMSSGGARRSVFLEQEPDLGIVPGEAMTRAWNEADYRWVNIKPYCRRLLPALQGAGEPIWCDLHDYDEGNPYHRPFIDAADYLMLSGEALANPDRFMAEQIDAGKRLVIITGGAQDIRAMDERGNRYLVPTVPCREAVDSNGAGDAFSAGFLYGWHRGRAVEQCLQLGACAGVLCLGSRALAAPQMDADVLEELWSRSYC
ncbi:MAG: carbohydrate kinase family protein [Oceanospirillaceae bacterium]|nr:carbohydrate kinase family protein [Oceanospirillaceae bacterium]